MKVTIGKSEAGAIQLALEGLIKGKFMVAASSGGGKSNLIRVVCENYYGHVPIIILDREGEFANLRKECPDFLVFGKGHDMPIHPAMAAMLARRLWENRYSAIIDLSEMPEEQRHLFVKLFTKALVDADKALWRPLILIYDEAHQFCPENGEGSSVAKNAIVELMSVARKRFIGVVLATQRVAKLDKSAISECRNLMVGFHNRHDDRRQIGKELGFSTKEELFSIKTLEEGQFFMLGPAMAREVTKVQVSLAKSNPPDSKHFGKRFTAPKASLQVKKLLDTLKDLPKEVEAEAKTLEEMKAEIKRLQGELKKIPKPEKIVEKVDEAKIKAEIGRTFTKSVIEWQKNLKEIARRAISEVKEWEPIMPPSISSLGVALALPSRPKPTAAAALAPADSNEDLGEYKWGKCERAIVGFLNFKPERSWTKVQVGVGIGYSWNSGSFNNALGKLRSAGAITGSGDAIQILDASICPGTPPAENPLEAWKANLGKCEKMIWDRLMETPSEWFTKEELGGFTGYSADSGSFNNALGRLNSLGLIERKNGAIRLNSALTF